MRDTGTPFQRWKYEMYQDVLEIATKAMKNAEVTCDSMDLGSVEMIRKAMKHQWDIASGEVDVNFQAMDEGVDWALGTDQDTHRLAIWELQDLHESDQVTWHYWTKEGRRIDFPSIEELRSHLWIKI